IVTRRDCNSSGFVTRKAHPINCSAEPMRFARFPRLTDTAAMKLLAGFIAVITGFTTQETLEGKDYGLVEDSCEEYFHNAKSWPLTDKYPGAIRLCQNIAGKPHKFATLYDIPTGIPVYSAYIGNRSPDKTHHDRPDSRKRWPRLAKSLCFDGDFDSEKSYASRIDHVYHSDWAFCGKHQTVNDDYLGEHDLIHIDRGHVDPNEINNEDPDAQDTTFTLTNVAPQASIFNGTVLNLFNNYFM
ncbi:unnamed protein product, partial [Oikopleura dioica]